MTITLAFGSGNGHFLSHLGNRIDHFIGSNSLVVYYSPLLLIVDYAHAQRTCALESRIARSVTTERRMFARTLLWRNNHTSGTLPLAVYRKFRQNMTATWPLICKLPCKVQLNVSKYSYVLEFFFFYTFFEYWRFKHSIQFVTSLKYQIFSSTALNMLSSYSKVIHQHWMHLHLSLCYCISSIKSTVYSQYMSRVFHFFYSKQQ